MLVVLPLLVTMVVVGALLVRATGRVETASRVVSGLDTASWREAAGQLRLAGEELRDAVDLREHR